MKSIAMLASVVIVAFAVVGCSSSSPSSSTSTRKTARGNDVLDVRPTAAATPAKRSTYVGPSQADPMAPADDISYPPAGPVASYSPTAIDVAPAAPTVAPGAQAGSNSYRVKAGDTLFGIARTTYGDGSQWKKIASANPGLSPKSLKAGQTITLP